jgi:hypothetical protein
MIDFLAKDSMALNEENLPSRPNQEKNQDRANDDIITRL